MNARNFSVVSSILLGLLVLVPVLGMSLIGGWAITGPGMFGGLGMAYGPVVGATFLLVLVASIATIVFFLTRRSDPWKHSSAGSGLPDSGTSWASGGPQD